MILNSKEVRKNFSTILKQANAGAEVTITLRGREVARLVPPLGHNDKMLDFSTFRNSITVEGKATSELVVTERNNERY